MIPFMEPRRNVDDARNRLNEFRRRIDAYPDKAVWIHLLSQNQIDDQLQTISRRQRDGIEQPLFGLTFAAKDNIDVAGVPTTAACPEFSYIPKKSATVISRLCDAGAIVVGKTNLDQFATGLVGTRSPYGAVKNPFNADYISGGSSSGSAVAVAANLVDFSLGTDTAGSGRVPAAFCNLVGLKPTRGLISTTGVVDACRSLDCVSIFTHCCNDAMKIFSIARGFDPQDIYSRKADDLNPPASPTNGKFRFGVPRDSQLQFFGNRDAEMRYAQAIERAQQIGGTRVEIDFVPFQVTAELLYNGPWVAERFLVAKNLLEKNPDSILPVTLAILEKANHFSAADAFAAQYKLLELRREAQVQWEKMDTLLLPTTGTIYTIAQVQADPFQLNHNLGYYTNFANLLDLCAVAVPNGFHKTGLPCGVTLMAPAGQDDWLLSIAGRFESAHSGDSK
jgi:allophanate hydrolase